MTSRNRAELDLRREPQGKTIIAESTRRFMFELKFRGLEPGAMWPSDKYTNDPIAFVREVLNADPWSRQCEILEAVRDNPRTAVRSGHKIGKSFVVACLALWFYCTYQRARVILTSTTSRQVDAILWTEIRMMCKRATIPIGEPAALARTGLKPDEDDDFREIVGFTARQAEAVAGISGPRLLYLPDEASGVEDHIFEAIEGNMMGGAKMALFGNPTRNEGEFFEACEGAKKKFYKVITVSSTETPNYVERTDKYPGLATYEEVETKRQIYGEDSAWWKVRVLGLHALSEDARILNIHQIAQAQLRWHDMRERESKGERVVEAEGRLHIGCDPAGVGGAGDESAFAARRGLRIFGLHARRGLSEEAHLVEVLGMCSLYKKPGETEKPLVIIDRDGAVGAKVWGVFMAYIAEHDEKGDAAFELIGIRSSENAKRKPLEYHLVRDEAYWIFADWIKAGGAIPEDAFLEKDLHAPKWEHDIKNRAKATDKKVLRKILGRSPDRGDACILTTWTPSDYEHTAQANLQEQARVARVEETERAPTLDPYSAGDAWDPRRRR